MPAHEARWLRWDGADGQHGACYAKALLWDQTERPHGPVVFIQLKEAACSLGLPHATRWWRWLDSVGALKDADEAFLWLGASELDRRPSRRAARERSLPEARQGFCTQCPSVSTVLFLLHLAQYACKLYKRHKVRARSYLDSFVVAALKRDMAVVANGFLQNAVGDGEKCCSPHECDEPGLVQCSHVTKLLAPFLVEGDLRVELVADVLVQGYHRKDKCEVLRRWYYGLIKTIAGLIDGGVERWGSSFEHTLHLRGPCKRRNLDVDAMAGAHALVASGRFRSLAAAATAGAVDCEKRSAATAEEKFVRSYVKETMKTFAGVNQLAFCFDESCVSKEGTLLSLVYDRLSGKSAWTVPQVAQLRFRTFPPGMSCENSCVRNSPSCPFKIVTNRDESRRIATIREFAIEPIVVLHPEPWDRPQRFPL